MTLYESLVGTIIDVITKSYNRINKRPRWFSGPIFSGFERKGDKLLVKLEFELINGGEAMSIWSVFLKIKMINPHFPQLGEFYSPQDFKPINIGAGKTRVVTLTFMISKPPELEDIQNMKRDKLINHGIHAELQLSDNECNLSTSPLFIYEGGLEGLSTRIVVASSHELYLILTRGKKSFLISGKLRGNEILK